MEQEHFSIGTTAAGHGVGFSWEERERHLYIIGKSGSGKSTLMFNLAMGDILAGDGVAVIDPHGDLALDILDAIPPSRINDVCYLDATDIERPVGFNPITRVAPGRRALAAAGIVSAFRHLWSDSWGPRLEHFLFHGVAALISRPHATLIDLPRLYTDELFRSRVIDRVRDPETRRFWFEEYPNYPLAFRNEAAAPILNKAGQIAASPQLRVILGQLDPRLDLSFVMNKRRILIANLAKGVIGEQASNLLGSLLVSHLQLIAMERGSMPPEDRVPFHIHIDEFQTFSSDTFATLLSESRKFKLRFSLVNQFLDQVAPIVRAAVLGNVGSLVVFRVGSTDAKILAPELHPIEPGGLTDQLPFTAWVRRSDGGQSRLKIEPKLFPQRGRGTTIKEQSRQRFGRARQKIEDRLYGVT